ncbi:non-ribosomal peptide synthetase [Stigmatella hybrida]|uniref:non-ribosomal peptide synthetase n=1 Tax=Stigmatella hybrida TaxID=394097 RepID=UPI001CDB1ED1|nr:non-ribosomal peptide synthetase [Stigmatella hybrida]
MSEDPRSKLSPTKLALLRAMQRGQLAGTQATVPTPAPEARPQLSSTQERLLFFEQLHPGTSVQNLWSFWRLTGPLEVAALQRAVEALAQRHDALRMCFAFEDGHPTLVVDPAPRLKVAVVELASPPTHEELLRLAREHAEAPFELTRGPLARIILWQTRAHEHWLLLVAHHTIFDGWSLGLFLQELSAYYRAYTAGQLPPVESGRGYVEAVHRQRTTLRPEALKRQLSYWREQLGGGGSALQLPGQRPAARSFAGALYRFEVPAALAAEVKALGRSENTTAFAILLTAFLAVLHRFSGEAELVVGTPVSGRLHPGLEQVLGPFINTLALRTDVSGNPSFRELLSRVRERLAGALANQELPFQQVVEALPRVRTAGRQPFQAMFIFHNQPSAAFSAEGLEVSRVELDATTSQFSLCLEVEDAPGGMRAVFQYGTDILEASLVARLAEGFQRLLTAAVAAPRRRLLELPLLSEAERQQQLIDWNATAAPVPASDVAQEFEAQARATPGAVALRFGHEALTYRELDARASTLAALLVQLGAGPEHIVALCLHRSVEMVVGMLATLKAGAAYLPLDPTYPPARLAFMLEDSRATVLLTENALKPLLAQVSLPVLLLDAPDRFDGGMSTRSAAGIPAESLAYLIYTSGSTGTPKAVMVTRRNLAAFLPAMDRCLRREGPGVWLAVTTIAFDIAGLELLWSLTRGFTVVLAPEQNGRARRPGVPHAPLPELLLNHGVTHLQCTPSLASLLLEDSKTAHALGGLRTLVLGGEALPPALVSQLRQWTRARILNAYGPTETTIWSSTHEVAAAEEPISIGQPIANTELYVLDAALTPVPIGAVGELYIGGAGVTRGYSTRPELTAERFVPEPFSGRAGARMYRTGDRARYRPDGRVDFLGRVDHQAKLRGFRIELGEVESVVGQHPGVRQAAVLVREDTPGEQRLVAYYAPTGEPPSPEALRAFIRERLPEYMVPSVWMCLEELPLTDNGKVNRRALPVPQVPDEAASEPLATPTEEVVARIWAEVLHLPRVHRTSSFFELGGHSLLATRTMARLREALAVDVPLSLLFEKPVLGELAAALQAAGKTSSPPSPRRLPPDTRPVPSPGQEQLWFLDQLEPDSPLYNHDVMIRLAGPLDEKALQRALQEIVHRHEVLRTLFTRDEDQVRPVVRADMEVPLAREDFSQVPTDERPQALERAAVLQARRPFSLAHGPLLRFTLFRLAAHEHVLLLVIHHIIWDGWSAGVLARELGALYEEFAAGRPSPLPALPLQYTDYAAWHRQVFSGKHLEAEQAFWRHELPEAPRLELPTDYRRPPKQRLEGAIERIQLPRPLVASLEAVGQREGATLFMTLLAAFQTFLHRLTGQEDIRVGAPVANRGRPELEGLLGYFVNTLVFRGELGGEPTFLELLQRVRQTALSVYAHQETPFARIVEALRPERDLSTSPLFQVMLILQNAPVGELRMGALQVERLEVPVTTARFDLTLMLEPTPEGLSGWLNYDTALFEARTIRRWVGQLQVLLEAVVARPASRLSELPLLSSQEMDRLLAPISEPESTLGDLCLHELFERHARQTPDALAVCFEERSWTYAQLEARANHLAHALIERGVASGARVALLLETGFEQVAAGLAVLKAGGAMVYLDVLHPGGRLGQILDDVEPAGLLSTPSALATHPELAARVPWVLDVTQVTGPAGAAGPPGRARPEDAAYLVYTSGSTGRPKGIEQSHRSFRQFLEWQSAEFSMAAQKRIAIWSPITYDACYCELLGALCFGATAVLAPMEVRVSPTAMKDWLRRERIHLLQTVPSFATRLLESLEPAAAGAAFPELQYVLLSGEPLPVPFARAWLERLGPRPALINLYGPTETVLATHYAVREVAAHARSIPVGEAIGGRQILLLDANQRPAPPGAKGEVYIRSRYLTRGYFRREEETRKVFLRNPLTGREDDPVYRTGDFARLSADGTLEFFGRADHLVKIRGNRVELGEVETVLARHEAVVECAVVLRLAEKTEEPRLVAYIVATRALATGELREYLSRQLPAFMVPSFFIPLEKLPRTSTHKIDRSALPAPALPSPSQEAGWVDPSAGYERRIAEIWQEVLGLERVSAHDNFFDLGGHSLLLVQVQGRLERALGQPVPLVILLQHPTVSALARWCTQAPPPPRVEQHQSQAENRRAAMKRLMERRASPPSKGKSGNDNDGH